MQRKVGIVSFVAIALLLSLSGADGKIYKDYVSINSRVPGDQLVMQSKSLSQNMNFFAKVYINLRYPDDLSHSKYMLSHLLVTGQDDTGYIEYKPESGGPGSDNMNCRIILDSVQHGNYQVFLYGKKK